MMLLAAPQSMALSSQADLHLSADSQISHNAGDSTNLSTQNNLIAHAQQKISLFAAQKRISAIAAKGNIALQAQGDGIEAIARKMIQIISTEDRIEITSPKEISLTAGGSQILLSGQGVLVKTGGKFEAKAGQHVFSRGRAMGVDYRGLPALKVYNERFSLAFPSGESIKGINYMLSSDRGEFAAYTDKKGRTQETHSDQQENLKLDLNWMELEASPNQDAED